MSCEEEINEEVVEDVEHRRQFITFTVNKQEYGIDIMSIKEIKGWSETTTLPNTPLYMRGVINLRGAVVPILDLRARFGMGTTDASSNHVVMIVDVDSRITGILVDGVSDILTVGIDEIKSIPDIDANQGTEVLSGLVNLKDRMVAILFLNKLLDSKVHIAPDMVEHMTVAA